jgi:hypothetical protein
MATTNKFGETIIQVWVTEAAKVAALKSAHKKQVGVQVWISEAIIAQAKAEELQRQADAAVVAKLNLAEVE